MTVIAEKYHEPVGLAVVAASALGPAGMLLPTLDTAGIGVIWTSMITTIAFVSNHDVDRAAAAKVAAKIATAAVGAVAGYQLGSKLLTWTLVVALPGAGVPTAMVANAALNGLFTLKLGLETARQFDRPDFDATDALKLAATIAAVLVPIPKAGEIKLLKEMIRTY